MRIALISPYSREPMRGNIVTVQRIARFLNQAGVATAVLAVDNLSVDEMQRRLAEFKPDLVHGFHAHYCGSISRHLAEHLQIPYVITMTGSDLHDSLLRTHPDTVSAIEAAQAIVCFHTSDADRLTGFFPGLHGKVAVVPQGVEALPVVASDSFGFNSESFVLLLPAVLRPVKGVEFPIKALSMLALGDQTLQLVIAGGVIDTDYAASIRTMLSDAPFVTWLGEVPHERMGSLYDRADLVLNCSRSESMPNSLMEAMAVGRPVLAANIPGNRSLVRNGKNGWLYDGEEDFRRLVRQIRGNALIRQETGHRAQEYIKKKFSPRLEAKRYLSLYRKLLRSCP
ncbi:MAG: glycosyltransferase [Desulfuromonadaceae bacterium]